MIKIQGSFALISFVSAVLSPILSSCQSLPATLSKPIEVHGHRGARARLPENTLPAFEYALGVGVDVLELDMAVTKDKVVVISHDPHVNPNICRNMNGQPITEKLLIWNLTYAELLKYDCGGLQNPKFPNQKPILKTPIPSLRQVFTLVRDSKLPKANIVRFNIETKIEADAPDATIAPREFVELVLKEVTAFGFESRVILQSFDYRTLAISKELSPNIKTSALGYPKPVDEWLRIAREFKVDVISPNYSSLSKSTIAELHRNNLKVIPWTANKQDDWESLIKKDVDGIISDDPESLIQYLQTLQRTY